jgi:hypothetical protein
LFKIASEYIVVIIFAILAQNLSSQTLFGFDISDPNDTTGFMFNNSLDAIGTDVYLKIDPGSFDRILLHKGIGFVCTINYPNANRFIEIYDTLKKNYGYENANFDIMPPGITEDKVIEMAQLIQSGDARIVRYWYEDKYNVKLDYSRKNLEVFISHFK